MSSYLHQLLADVFRAQGMADAERGAALAVETLLKVQVLPIAEVERFEEDARIYRLRGDGLTSSQLSIRFNRSRALIFRAIRRHAQRRRAALKIA